VTHPSVRHEKRDVSAGAVARFGLILAVVTVLTAVLLYPVFGWLRTREGRQDPPAPPMGRQAPGRLPPEPRLQVAPPQELEAARREADQVLQSYGWVDEDKGIVRIPIEDAMRLLVERSAAPAPAASPSVPAPAPSPGRGRTP
jgi:hypothetical protein